MEGPEWDNDRPYAECVEIAICRCSKWLPVGTLVKLLHHRFFCGFAVKDFRVCPGPPPPPEFADLVHFAQARIQKTYAKLLDEVATVLDEQADRFIKPKIPEMA